MTIHQTALKSQTILVTPALATKWLNEANVHNRKLKNKVVKKYADEMERGLWRLNGVPIVFTAGKARLLDGQHRLWACIESGCSFTTIVTEGVDAETFTTFDVGSTRSSEDMLDIDDVQSSNNRQLAAAAGLVMRYRAGKVWQKILPAKAEIIQFIRNTPELQEWLERVRSYKGWTRTYAPQLAAVMFIAAHRYPSDAEEFTEQFATGENLTGKAPALALRNRFGTEKKVSTEDRMALIVMAWNAHIESRELAKVQLPKKDSPFPKIVGAKK